MFSQSKVTNFKNSREFFLKGIHILKPSRPCSEFFKNSPYSWKETGMYFTLSLVKEICKLIDIAIFGELYKLGKNSLLINLENEKIHLHDFWLCRLFYQPNLEISSLIQKNNHPCQKYTVYLKIERNFCGLSGKKKNASLKWFWP